jgi:hypothetical protein
MEQNSYGIRTSYSNEKVCIKTSAVYLTKEEFEAWVKETQQLIEKELHSK